MADVKPSGPEEETIENISQVESFLDSPKCGSARTRRGSQSAEKREQKPASLSEPKPKARTSRRHAKKSATLHSTDLQRELQKHREKNPKEADIEVAPKKGKRSSKDLFLLSDDIGKSVMPAVPAIPEESRPKLTKRSRRRAGSDPTRRTLNLLVPISLEDSPESRQMIAVIQKYIRSSNAKTVVRRRGELQIERTHIVKEILSTEQTYFNALTELVKGYLEPIKARVWTEIPIISNELMNAILPDGLRDILKLSETFLAEFTAIVAEWRTCSLVSPAFLKLYASLSDYAPYVQNYPICQISLPKAQADSGFQAFLVEKYELPDFQKFVSLLITPIQRIPRYKLLLESLLKSTWADHPDYLPIAEAVQSMEQAAKYVNESSRAADQIIQIQNSLVGMKNSIIDSKRKLIKEGDLDHWSKGEWKIRRFFLFTDILIRARASTKKDKQYHFLEKIPIKGIKMGTDIPAPTQSEINNLAKCKQAFWIQYSDSIDWLVSCSDMDEKKDWMHAMKTAQSTFNQHEQMVQEMKLKKAERKANQVKNSLGFDYYAKFQKGPEVALQGVPEANPAANNRRAYARNKPVSYTPRSSAGADEDRKKKELQDRQAKEEQELEDKKDEEKWLMQVFLDEFKQDAKRTAYRESKQRINKQKSGKPEDHKPSLGVTSSDAK